MVRFSALTHFPRLNHLRSLFLRALPVRSTITFEVYISHNASTPRHSTLLATVSHACKVYSRCQQCADTSTNCRRWFDIRILFWFGTRIWLRFWFRIWLSVCRYIRRLSLLQFRPHWQSVWPLVCNADFERRRQYRPLKHSWVHQ